MTDKEKLLELAKRCEAAAGPDRELDDAIYEGIGNCLHAERAVSIVAGDPDDDEDFPYFDHACKKCGRPASMRVVPATYTASMDAAMTLVPEGVRWCIDTLDNGGPPMAATGNPAQWKAAVTPALALCAAALRAKATV